MLGCSLSKVGHSVPWGDTSQSLRTCKWRGEEGVQNMAWGWCLGNDETKMGMVRSEAHGIVLVLNTLYFARQSDPNSHLFFYLILCPNGFAALPGKVGDDRRQG